jgi:hypothetical protein
VKRIAGRALLSLGIAAVVGISPASATTIVVLASADRVVVAADSRVTRSGDPSVVDDTACKILVRGTTAATMSGEIADVDGRFDARRAIPRALSTRGSVRDKYLAALQMIGEMQVGNGNPPGERDLSLLIVTVDSSGAPDWAVGEIHLPADHLPGPTLCTNSGPCILSAFIGEPIEGLADLKARIDGELQRRPSENRMVQLAREAIQSQAVQFPTKVGGPTDVLVLDRYGARWLARKRICPTSVE